jgi:hypothetical protein
MDSEDNITAPKESTIIFDPLKNKVSELFHNNFLAVKCGSSVMRSITE